MPENGIPENPDEGKGVRMQSGPSDLGGTDSLSQREDWVINTLSRVATEVQGLSEDSKEVKRLVSETNGRLREVEGWRREVKGQLSVIAGSGKTLFIVVAGPIAAGVITGLLLGH